MDAGQRPGRVALSLIAICTLAISTGCNPLGWGVSQVKNLIHHHAQRPVLPGDETWPAAAGPQRTSPGDTSARPA